MASSLTEQVKGLPASPGVYLFKDAEGNIFYVGKAANLRHRVSSHLGGAQKLTPKLGRMMSKVSELDYFVTGSEQEALILELNLIKRHHPPYNVRLKDDKTFPYLKIDPGEDWPRVYVTRHLEEDGGRYFGPFASARSVRQTLKLIKGIFPFRSCSKAITGIDRRPCLEYDIGHCLGPCIGAVSREEYAEVIRQVILFLDGRQERVVRELEERMNKAAENLDFETAARLRDQIQAVERVVEGQRIATRVRGEQDVIAFAQDGDQACVQVFFIRGGRLIGRESFVLQGTRYEEPPQVMTSFIKQFYASSAHIPPLLLLQHSVEDVTTIQSWLEGKRGGKVEIQVPRRGAKKELLEIVAKNAQEGLEQLRIKELTSPSALSTALEEIKRELALSRLPARIEGYDISDIQGMAAVGSMVVFEKGKPKPAHYRRFKIRTISAPNDYAMLGEVLRRRFGRVTEAKDSWAILPDLILIDGGRGHLNAASEVLAGMGVDSVSIASLAKENEEIFISSRPEPIVLPRSSPALKLLQRLRDEAHRFALGYHQRVRQKEAFASVLDSIPGIGPKRKKALLRHFGSVKAIREASIEELATARGMTASLAKKLKEHL